MRAQLTMLLTLVGAFAAATPAAAAPYGPVANQCPEQLVTPCYGADVVVRDAEATAQPGRHERDIREFEGSWTHRALAFQH